MSENKNADDPFPPQTWRWMIERGHNVYTPMQKYIPPPLVKPTLFKRIINMMITIICWIVLIGLFIGYLVGFFLVRVK
jgi:hypothetical protein